MAVATRATPHSQPPPPPPQPQVYRQKVKHLLFEHQHTAAALKADAEHALALAADDARRREAALAADKRALARGAKEAAAQHRELERALRLDGAKEGGKARQEFERAAAELAAKYDKRAKALREELDLRRRHELHEVPARARAHEGEREGQRRGEREEPSSGGDGGRANGWEEQAQPVSHPSPRSLSTPPPPPPPSSPSTPKQVEERKNAHIAELTRRHEAAFAEVKGYYGDVTAGSLDLVKVCFFWCWCVQCAVCCCSCCC